MIHVNWWILSEFEFGTILNRKLLDISTNASRIHRSATLLFMVTNGRIVFVTQHPTTYSRNNDQVKEAEDGIRDAH